MRAMQWKLGSLAVVLAGLGGWVARPVLTHGADRRIADDQLFTMEARLGYHLYAPTWLPQGGHTGALGTIQGQYRVLQDFSAADGRPLVYLAQERRNRDRDRYNHHLFVDLAEASARVKGTTGYLVTGQGGERRLFWLTPDTALILSSTNLSDDELAEVAAKVE